MTDTFLKKSSLTARGYCRLVFHFFISFLGDGAGVSGCFRRGVADGAGAGASRRHDTDTSRAMHIPVLTGGRGGTCARDSPHHTGYGERVRLTETGRDIPATVFLHPRNDSASTRRCQRFRTR
jgi:hypothetical protein